MITPRTFRRPHELLKQSQAMKAILKKYTQGAGKSTWSKEEVTRGDSKRHMIYTFHCPKEPTYSPLLLQENHTKPLEST